MLFGENGDHHQRDHFFKGLFRRPALQDVLFHQGDKIRDPPVFQNLMKRLPNNLILPDMGCIQLRGILLKKHQGFPGMAASQFEAIKPFSRLIEFICRQLEG